MFLVRKFPLHGGYDVLGASSVSSSSNHQLARRLILGTQYHPEKKCLFLGGIVLRSAWRQLTLQTPCWSFPPSLVTLRNAKLESEWLTSFDKRQVVERNRKSQAVFSFNYVQHVGWHISTFNITWYTPRHLLNSSCNICCSTDVEQCILGLVTCTIHA